MTQERAIAILEAMLEMSGHSFLANDGEEALERVTKSEVNEFERYVKELIRK